MQCSVMCTHGITTPFERASDLQYHDGICMQLASAVKKGRKPGNTLIRTLLHPPSLDNACPYNAIPCAHLICNITPTGHVQSFMYCTSVSSPRRACMSP
jgi:hypothetical protein